MLHLASFLALSFLPPVGDLSASPADNLATSPAPPVESAPHGYGVAAASVAPPLVLDPFGIGFDTFGVVHHLGDGTLVSFDGQVVRHHAAGGKEIGVLATLDQPTFAAFVRSIPGEDALLVGESSTGELWRIELDGAGAKLLASLELPFDATIPDAHSAFVNAAACVGCDTEILHVDLESGAVTSRIALDGPSGPLVHDGAGGLYVADFSASFGGPVRVLHFDASQLAAQVGGPPLIEAHGSVLSDGYAGISSLAYDPVLGNVFVAENSLVTGAGSIKIAGGNADTDPVLLTGKPYRWLSELQFVPGPQSPFHAYQPKANGSLTASSIDYATKDASRLSLFPKRAHVSLEGPGVTGPGPVRLRIEGGPPLGTALALLAPAAAVVDEYELKIEGSLPWFTSLSLAELNVTNMTIELDADGSGELVFMNALGMVDALAVQLVCIQPDGAVVGLSSLGVL